MSKLKLVLPIDVTALLDALPLPLGPAEAWRRLDPMRRDEIGTIAVAMVFTAFLSGRAAHPDDWVLAPEAAHDADRVSDRLLDMLHANIAEMIPELFGPEGDHPDWATPSLTSQE